MPRKARLDAPSALHHIIIRGIERKAMNAYWVRLNLLSGC
jgi:hypothetical protein